jgi:thioredoxin-dependent peroxiredoxin
VHRSDGGRGLLPVGGSAPTLTATDQHGAAIQLAPPLPHYTVVYFYPKDGTPGCTAEACAFRDVWKRYQDASVDVYGVSSDDAESHKSFAKDEAIPFSLIADTEGTWANAFGVPNFMGLYSRVSFLLAPNGKVARVYKDVDPGIHAKQILADVQSLRRVTATQRKTATATH